MKVELEGSVLNAYQSGIGHHSELIDHLGRYGIVGLAFYFIIFRNFLLKLRAIYLSKEGLQLRNIIFFAFASFSLLNNSFTPHIGVAIFLLLPLTMELYGGKGRLNDEPEN